MNNLRQPEIPAPPALPRFALPHDEQLDALDVAATSQRPTVKPGRVRKTVAADATAEVQVEDILIEVYAEDPPPPLTRDVLSESDEARDSIAMAIASVVPPARAQSAAVDALLRASDPAFAPFPGHLHAYGARASFASADYETPSVGPMMMASAPPSGLVLGDVRAKRRATALAIWAIVITVLGVAGGAAMTIAVRNGTYARLRDSAKTALRASTKHDAPIAAASAPPAVAPPPVVGTTGAPPALAVAPAPAVPTMSIDALPKPAVAADASLVTFPAYAEGHRVFLDGRVLAVVSGTPTTIKCGRHMLKIGSTRRPRAVDFACGREVIVQ